jgi:hypothetical protein
MTHSPCHRHALINGLQTSKDIVVERPKSTQLAPFHLHTSDRAMLRSRRSSATFTDCQHAATLKQALISCNEVDAAMPATVGAS